MPGPPRKPEALRKLAAYPDRRPPRKEPKPQRLSDLDPPPILTGAARAHWAEIVPRLWRLGLVSEIDAPNVVVLCTLWEKLLAAKERLDKMDVLMLSKGGDSLRVHPAWYVFKEAAIAYAALSQQFGMTPASRTRVAQAPELVLRSASVTSLAARRVEQPPFEF